MKLIHYSQVPIYKLEDRNYEDDRPMGMKGCRMGKPDGLWVSVENEYGWNEWCTSEDYALKRLKYQHKVILKKEAKILHLKSNNDILNFTKEYGSLSDDFFINWAVDYNSVKSKYQGIIISPYQWDCRLHPQCGWYYGWDCASGCIWDLSCIKIFQLITKSLPRPRASESTSLIPLES